ncbi:LON peptidase substrate-binding domain-containing protein [Aureicoccus marinus]|uniref:ATP-dependent protease n=1 Tax=Aureicoccus marinus TaxID=754435 RepID=A0A2S7T3X5_9FLAO|nr:LON peptidase substrate-binding domain-containing protein [Aureicoccus marinus]PQJ14620.1 ATP-dependent protease [Aureicoccus marinus]
MHLAQFPLQSVFYPGETVPLHIFEDRYKHLISDCKNETITFGIPVYLNERLQFGTEVQLVEVVTTYAGGEMDVVCLGRQVYELLTFEPEMKDKPYAGGLVRFLEHENDGTPERRAVVFEKLKRLYELMGVVLPPEKEAEFNSYQYAHKMGLTLEQEYKMLQISRESERLDFIDAHLNTTIQVLQEVDRTKQKIELNGHFRNFDPLDFKKFEL